MLAMIRFRRDRASLSATALRLSLGLVAWAGAVAPAAAQSPAPATVTEVTLPAELDRVLRDYEAAWAARDAEALAALFAPDGFVLRGGHPPVRGRADIAVAYQGSGGPLHLMAYAFSVEGDVGWIVGGYGRSPDVAPGGKYVLALTRGDDGRWLIAADMDNGND